jgi:hypothetical protein
MKNMMQLCTAKEQKQINNNVKKHGVALRTGGYPETTKQQQKEPKRMALRYVAE